MLTPGASDIKPHEIVAPLTEIVFAPASGISDVLGRSLSSSSLA